MPLFYELSVYKLVYYKIDLLSSVIKAYIKKTQTLVDPNKKSLNKLQYCKCKIQTKITLIYSIAASNTFTNKMYK